MANNSEFLLSNYSQGVSYDSFNASNTLLLRNQPATMSDLSLSLYSRKHSSPGPTPDNPDHQQHPHSDMVQRCTFRKEVIDDCARTRLWNRMAEVYLIDPSTNIPQEIRCPLSKCPKTFPCPKEMLLHLKFCGYFSDGSFKCPICHEREEYPKASCRKGRWNKVPLRQRLGNSMGSFCSSIGISSRGSVSQTSLHHCEGCSCSDPLWMRPSSASSEGTLSSIEKSARADSAMAFHSNNSFMDPNTLGNANIGNSTLNLPQYGTSELYGDTGAVEIEDTKPKPIAELPGPSANEIDLSQDSDSESPIILSQHAVERRHSLHVPSTELSTPSTSRSRGSPTSVSSASSENDTNQRHTVLGSDVSNYEQMPSSDDSGLQMDFQELHDLAVAEQGRQPQGRFDSPSHVSDLYNFSLNDVGQSTVDSVFKHRSVYQEPPSLPAGPCWQTPVAFGLVSSNFASTPQNQDLKYFASDIVGPHVTTTTNLGSPQQFISIDTAYLGNHPSSMESPTPVYDTSPSSKSATSFPGSAVLSPDQVDDELEVLKCDECGFEPTGKVKSNFRAYLRKHRRTHTAPQVICTQCKKGFTRQDNLTAHKKRVHLSKRRFENETGFGEQTPQTKKYRLGRSGGSESPGISLI